MVGTALFPTQRRTTFSEKLLVSGFIIAHQAEQHEFSYVTKREVSRREIENSIRETISSDFILFDSSDKAEAHSENTMVKGGYCQRSPVYQVEFPDDFAFDSNDKQITIDNMKIVSCNYHVHSDHIQLGVDARDYNHKVGCGIL